MINIRVVLAKVRDVRRKQIWNFIKLTRPLFLMGGLMLYSLGGVIAIFEGAQFHVLRFISGQVLVTAIQLMTHYANEYFDQEGDRQNSSRTWFSGGSGVLTSGDLSPAVAQKAAFLLVGISLLALTNAGLQVPVVFILGLVSFIAAWSYSGPPFALVNTGWGELSASMVVAFLVPIVGYAMQSGGSISSTVIITSLPLVLIHLAMLIAFEIPDYKADQAVGKRTLCVRFGEEQVARLHNYAIVLAFCAMVGLSIMRWPGAQFAWLAFPLALWQSATIRRYLHRASLHYHHLTIGALGLFAITAGLWLAGYAWLYFNS